MEQVNIAGEEGTQKDNDTEKNVETRENNIFNPNILDTEFKATCNFITRMPLPQCLIGLVLDLVGFSLMIVANVSSEWIVRTFPAYPNLTETFGPKSTCVNLSVGKKSGCEDSKVTETTLWKALEYGFIATPSSILLALVLLLVVIIRVVKFKSYSKTKDLEKTYKLTTFFKVNIFIAEVTGAVFILVYAWADTFEEIKSFDKFDEETLYNVSFWGAGFIMFIVGYVIAPASEYTLAALRNALKKELILRIGAAKFEQIP